MLHIFGYIWSNDNISPLLYLINILFIYTMSIARIFLALTDIEDSEALVTLLINLGYRQVFEKKKVSYISSVWNMCTSMKLKDESFCRRWHSYEIGCMFLSPNHCSTLLGFALRALKGSLQCLSHFLKILLPPFAIIINVLDISIWTT